MRFESALWMVVSVMAFATGARDQPTASIAPRAEFAPLAFLLGEWEAAPGTSGETGEFSFAFDVQGRVMTRNNFADYPVALGRPASRHDDLMIIYAEAGLKADYFDSEGHVIRYAVQPRRTNEVVFLSEPKASEPRYRLSYTLAADGTLKGQFDVAAPGAPDAFKPYLSWTARKKK